MRQHNPLATRSTQALSVHARSAPLARRPVPLAAQLPSEKPEPSLLRAIVRRWWLVLICVLLGAGTGYAYLRLTTPLYTSIAKLYIQPAPTPNSNTPMIGFAERASFLEMQASTVRSTPVLNRVAEVEGMRAMKTFFPARSNPVLYLHENLDVDLERKTDLITISLDSPYPEESLQIVSTVVRCYVETVREEKDELGRSLLEQFRKAKQLQDDELARMEAELKAFRSDHPEAMLISGDAGGGVLASINNVGSDLTRMELEQIETKLRYGEAHPRYKALDSQIAANRRMYDALFVQLSQAKNESAELTRMEERVRAARQTVDGLAQRVQELELSANTHPTALINIIEPPQLQTTPSHPDPIRVWSIAIVLGTLLGAGLALLRDRMDERMRSVEEIQTVVGLPILGVVPAMSGRRTAVARAMTVHLDPRSVVAEAYRTVRTAVYFGTDNDRCKTILVTSPEPGDGKTTSASNLAIAIAQTGRTVLLLDADFRKPTQHKNLDIKNAIGLSSVLAGREPIEHAIQRTGVDGLDILPCGPVPANPSEILNSREFGELVDALAHRYDHILFDSPPVNAVTDARILSAVSDATILVLRADKSTRKSGEHARNAMIAVGAKILGAIVNDAPKSSRRYGVYGGGYYGSPDRVETGVRTTSRRPTEEAKSDADDEEAAARRRNIA